MTSTELVTTAASKGVKDTLVLTFVFALWHRTYLYSLYKGVPLG